LNPMRRATLYEKATLLNRISIDKTLPLPSLTGSIFKILRIIISHELGFPEKPINVNVKDN